MIKDFICVLGPQGSGKSTQAKLIADFLGYEFISSGELVRNLSESNDPRAIEFEKYWKFGALVPNSLVENLFFENLERSESKGFVLDGYPRNEVQIKHFSFFLEKQNWRISKAFYILVSDSECIRRIRIRAEQENREDEKNEESILERLRIYHKETEPLLNEYRKIGVLCEINGERSIDEIIDDIKLNIKK